jgi:hypothetical protein
MNVFISHAATDGDLAHKVASTLREAGFSVWDDSQILPGENWGERLAEALQQADAMVVLITPDSLRSPNMNYEVGYALGKEGYKGRLIPVRAAPPDQLPEERIPWILRKLRTVDLADRDKDEEGLSAIVRALKAAA